MSSRAFAVVLVAAVLSLAQSASAAYSERFRHLTITDGLVQNSAQALAQDSTGYIWIGTQEGLHRYDGLSLDLFRFDPEEPYSLGGNSVNFIVAADDGVMWIAHDRGVDRYDPSTGRFEHLRHADPESDTPGMWSEYALALLLASDGRLWIAGDQGVDIYNPSDGSWERYGAEADADHALPSNFVYALYEGDDGTVYIGAEEGLFLLADGRGAPVPFDWGEDADPLDEHAVYAVFEDSAGRLWLGHWYGLTMVDVDGAMTHWPEADTSFAEGAEVTIPRLIYAITEGKRGEIWVGTVYGGLVQVFPETGRLLNSVSDPGDPSGLSNNEIWSLLVDDAGLLWIGTSGGGVNLLDPATAVFQHYRYLPTQEGSLPATNIWGMLADSRGRLWISTTAGLALKPPDDDALVVFTRDDSNDEANYEYAEAVEDEEAQLARHWERWFAGDSIPHDWINSVYEDSQGRIWVGTSYGVALYQEDGTFRRYNWPEVEEGLQYMVMDILALTEFDGYMWAGNYEGMVRFDPDTGDYRRYTEGDPEAPGFEGGYVGTFVPLPDGSMLVLTDAAPLIMSRDGEGYSFERLDQPGTAGRTLRSASANDALVQGERLWLGTSLGLHSVDLRTRTVERIYTVVDGLPSDVIYAIEEDASGNIWVSTTRGLSELDRVAHVFRNYDYNDGLQSDEFNGGSSARFSDGRLAFGGINGLNIFDPADVIPNTSRPRVAITRFFKYDEEQDLDGMLAADGRVILDHFDDVIAIEFIAFDFAAPERNRFEFKLEGFDEFWRDDATGNRITYTNLDPGEYVFQVRGTNKDGVWSEDAATLRISVLPAPWATWWAYSAYVLLSLSLLYAGWRLQKHRLLRENALKHEQQRRHWAETLNQLTQALLGTLDDSEIADQLLDNLGWIVPYESAALYLEQGTEIRLVAHRGLRTEDVLAFRLLPEDSPQIFAGLRASRAAAHVGPDVVQGTPLQLAADPYWLAVPMTTRAEEFALLLLGRAQREYEPQEIAMTASFAQQAVVALENAKLFAEVQNLATTDGLTRLSTRRHFLDQAELEYTRSRRYGRRLSLLMLDADRFKQVNDDYGHEVGDRVLKLIASVCRTNLRHFDIIGRYGGEEFIIALPETGGETAAEVAERIRAHVAELVVTTHKGDLKVSVSLGSATLSEDIEDLADLINRADAALYAAKRGGRNQVRTYSNELEGED
jgi:diguanylate cyclase (GGDEF)-like protein